MKNLYLPFLWIAVLCNSGFSQKNSPLECKIEFYRDSIELLEPLKLQFALINTGLDTLEILLFAYAGGAFYFIEGYLEYKTSKQDLEWNKIELSSKYAARNYHGNPYFSLAPGDTAKSVMFFFPSFLIGQREQLDSVQIRLAFKPHLIFGASKNSVIPSTEKTLYFLPYASQDSLAYACLKTLPRPDFLYSFVYYGFGGFECGSEELDSCAYFNCARTIVQNYPESSFNLLSQQFLAHVYYSIASKLAETEETEKMIYNLAQSRKIALELADCPVPEIAQRARSLLYGLHPLIIRMACNSENDLESMKCFSSIMRRLQEFK